MEKSDLSFRVDFDLQLDQFAKVNAVFVGHSVNRKVDTPVVGGFCHSTQTSVIDVLMLADVFTGAAVTTGTSDWEVWD